MSLHINRVQLGHSNNSSSSHSILLRSSHRAIKHVESNFGETPFHLVNSADKMRYLIAQLCSILYTQVQEEFIPPIIESLFGVKITSTRDYSCDECQITLPYEYGYLDLRGNVSSRPRFNLQFIRELTDFIVNNPNISIGQNVPVEDNQLLRDVQYCSQNYLIARKDQDWWTLYNPQTGARIRISFKDKPKPYTASSSPELVDLKITNYCTHGCPFCYMGSTVRGTHADSDTLFTIGSALEDKQVFEVAIGGGEPTQHPEFIDILYQFHNRGITPNFTTFRLDWLNNPSIVEAVSAHVGSIATSDLSVANRQYILQAQQLNDFPQITLQIPLGGYPVETIKQSILWAKSVGVPITLLGFKTLGRGAVFTPYPFPDIVQFLATSEVSAFGADTLFVEQYRNELLSTGVLPVLMVPGEGRFSMYIDAVNCTISESSCVTKNSPFNQHTIGAQISKEFPYVTS